MTGSRSNLAPELLPQLIPTFFTFFISLTLHFPFLQTHLYHGINRKTIKISIVDEDVVVGWTLPEFWKRWLLTTRTTEFACSWKRFIATGEPACIDSRPIFLENLSPDYKFGNKNFEKNPKTGQCFADHCMKKAKFSISLFVTSPLEVGRTYLHQLIQISILKMDSNIWFHFSSVVSILAICKSLNYKCN